MLQTLIRLPPLEGGKDSSYRLVSFDKTGDISLLRASIYTFLQTTYGLTECWLSKLSLSSDAAYCEVRLRLAGGKGGFGSQLRAQGNRMSSRKRAGSYESCRDLSGRRLRTVQQGKAMSEYLARKPELERKRTEEIRNRMEKMIELADRKPVFKDVQYIRVAQTIVDETEMSVHEAVLAKQSLDNHQGLINKTAGSSSTSGFSGDSRGSSSAKTMAKHSKGKEKALQQLEDEMGLVLD